MEWTMLSCFLFAIYLFIQVEPVASSPQGSRFQYPEPAPVNISIPERQGALLQLKDFVDQGNSLLKDRLTESYTNLKELLKEGDSVLKEQIIQGVAQVKEQRKEGDERLKEELNEDVAWLKDKLAKGQTRMKEELAEEEAKVKEELAEQKEALGRLKDNVQQQSHWSSAAVDADLKQQMADCQAELNTTKLQLQTTQTELRTSQESLQSTQESLQSTQESLQTSQESLQSTQESLESTQESLESTQESLESTQESLQSTQESLQSTQESLQSTQESLQSTQESLQSTQADLETTQEKVNSMEQELQRTREQLQSEVQASKALKTQLQTAEEEILSLKVRVNSSEFNCQDSHLGSSEMEENNSSARARKVSCDDGYVLACDRCLKAVDKIVNYTTARQDCTQMQARLIMPRLFTAIYCIWAFRDARGFNNTWVGADDMQEPGVFRWNDGTLLPDDSPLWWWNEEPDKHVHGATCVYFNPAGPGLWDYKCKNTYWYICEKDAI